ncbi:hypothetical protein BC937DRAFT_95291 [Endogone sp. FLAS-F59071]|nr:hypothetical protein BC937DRAFT_95291 [Endogone sp. FLAS-F59071]|eukprot:RUS20403.1 hypothetical protein BC937DRAFT_95291 [Endogone sp. FLAS-F59071]
MSSSVIAESAWPSSNMDVSVGELESYVDLPDTSENEATKNEAEGGQVAKEQQQYTGYHTTTTTTAEHHGFDVAWNHVVRDLSDNSHDMPQGRDNSLAESSQDHQTGWLTPANVHLDQTMADVALNEPQNEAQVDIEMPLGSTAELAGSDDPFIAGGFSVDDDTNPSNPSIGDEETISPGQISQPNSPTPNQGRTRSSSRRKPKSDSAQSQQAISAAEKKSVASKRGRKVYCICRMPDDGNTMVQCDACKEWYHIACVNLSEEEVQKMISYMCVTCQQAQNSGGIVTGRKVIPESTVTTRSRKNTSGENGKAGQEDIEVRKGEIEPFEQEPHMCLYPGCPNLARDGNDDYCSDNCTVKDSENVLRRLTAKNNKPEPLRTAQFHHRKTEDREWTPEEEEEDDEEEQHLRSQVKRSNSTPVFRRPRTYSSSSSKKRSEEMSEQSITPPASFLPQPVPEANQIPPAQVSPEQDPVRRNVIKNMTDVMMKIVTEAIEKDPELFTAPINSPTTPRTPWTDSPIHPMDDQAPSQQRQDEKEGSTSASSPTSATPSNSINITPSTPTSSAEEISNRLSRAIEFAMFELLADSQPSGPPKCGERYKGKFRSLLFNLKDKANEVFRLRVVTGDLTPEELIRMSAEDMANPALKSMSEVLRKRSIKDSVLKTQPNAPFIKKTHKGEVYLSAEPMMTYEREDKKAGQMPGLMEIDVEKSRVDERESGNAGLAVISPTTPTLRTDTLEEILARMGNGGSDEPARKGKRASVDFSKEGQNEKKMKLSPKLDFEDDAFAFDSDSDEAMEDSGFDAKQRQKPSKQQDLMNIDKSARSPNYTPYTPSPPNSPHTPDYSPPPSPGFLYKPIWRGKLLMQQVAQFEAEAVQIGGRPNLKGTDIPVMWEGVLSASTIAIDGRIPPDRVTDYLTQTQFSITKELTLVEFRPVVVDEDAGAGANGNDEADGDIGHKESEGTKNEKVDENTARFDTLLEYFSSRARFGVVGVKYMPTVKDMYIVPLRKDAPLPDCLVTMEHNLVETDRDRNMLLGIVVVNKKPPPSLKRSNRKPKETRRDSKEAETNAESLFSPREREIEEGEKPAEVVMETEEEHVPQEPVQSEPDRTIQIPSEPVVASTTINTSTIPLTAAMSAPVPTLPTNLNPLISQLLNNPDVLKLLSASSAGLNNNASNPPPPSASTVVNSIMGLNLGGLVMSQPMQAPLQQQYIPPLTSLPPAPQAGLYEPAVSVIPSIPHNAPSAFTPQYQPFYSQQPGTAISMPPIGMAPPPSSSFYEASRSGYQDHSAMQNKWEEERNWESRERGRDHRDGPHHPDDRGLDWDQRARERGYNRGDGLKGGREYHPYTSRDRDRDRKWGDEEDGGYRGRDELRGGGGRGGRGGRGRGGSWSGFDTRGGHGKKNRGRGNMW